MKLEPLGDSSFIIRGLTERASVIADRLNSLNVPGVLEAWASYDTVGIAVDALAFEPKSLSMATGQSAAMKEEPVKWVPVCFAMGEDLEESAHDLDLTAGELIEAFCAQPYTCFALGFCPGFPYLGYLPDRISGLKRLGNPRLKVPAGSVAITGRQVGIYPLERPGGWHILGRTPLEIVDVESAYFPIKAGDRIQFQRIDEAEFGRLVKRRL